MTAQRLHRGICGQSSLGHLEKSSSGAAPHSVTAPAPWPSAAGPALVIPAVAVAAAQLPSSTATEDAAVEAVAQAVVAAIVRWVEVANLSLAPSAIVECSVASPLTLSLALAAAPATGAVEVAASVGDGTADLGAAIRGTLPSCGAEPRKLAARLAADSGDAALALRSHGTSMPTCSGCPGALELLGPDGSEPAITGIGTEVGLEASAPAWGLAAPVAASLCGGHNGERELEADGA